MKAKQMEDFFIPVIIELETQEEVDTLMEALLRQAGRNEPKASVLANILKPYSNY